MATIVRELGVGEAKHVEVAIVENRETQDRKIGT